MTTTSFLRTIAHKPHQYNKGLLTTILLNYSNHSKPILQQPLVPLIYNHCSRSRSPLGRQTINRMASTNANANLTRDKLFDMKGRVALVTGKTQRSLDNKDPRTLTLKYYCKPGGGSGIGLMATQALEVNGAKVYITGRTKEKLDRVAETYSQGPDTIIPVPCDMGSKSEIKRLVDDISKREQCLYILVNNAGISSNTVTTETDEEGVAAAKEMKRNLFDTDKANFDDWANTYRNNVAQVYFATAAFLPLVQRSSERHSGWSETVINISSISGLIKSVQHHFAYNASKGAAVHLTRLLAAEVAENRLKIRINSIAPGVFPSEMTADSSGEDQKSHIRKDKYAKVPAERPGKDEDMAQAILFFAANQYLNGQTLAVDGGYTLIASQ